jgi:hypothetical protein
MTVSGRARHVTTIRRGRHAIQRARSSVEASRLRHAQLILPRGVYCTRVSAMRGSRGRAVVRLVGTSLRTPFRLMERILAVRLLALTG